MTSFPRKLWEAVTIWSPKATPTFGADVIITHAAADFVDGTQGPANHYLEQVVRRLHIETKLPIIAQGELAQYIRDLPLYGNIPKQSESPHYVDSVEVARIHKTVCDEYGWRHPILISYSHHLWRAKMVTRKAGFTDIRNLEMKSIYYRGSSQWWMASPVLNISREILCRLVWLVQGKI